MLLCLDSADWIWSLSLAFSCEAPCLKLVLEQSPNEAKSSTVTIATQILLINYLLFIPTIPL